MTRENKLAIVVGFSLILIVGILISDHYSAANTQGPADLLPPEDPLATGRRDNPELIEFAPASPDRRRADRMAARTGTIDDSTTRETNRDNGSRRSPAEQVPTLHMPDLQQPTDPLGHTDRFHALTSGENLTKVCQTYYDDTTLVRALARYNDIDDPNSIRAGRMLRVPPIEALRTGSRPAAETPPAQASRGGTGSTYRIKKGDRLWDLSERLLGAGHRWKELYEMNRDVIRDPDNLPVGEVMNLPPASRNE